MNELFVLQNGYSATRDGHIYSEKSKKFIRETAGNDGYARITVSINGIVSTHLVHRLVATAFIKNDCDYPEVNHKDENKLIVAETHYNFNTINIRRKLLSCNN